MQLPHSRVVSFRSGLLLAALFAFLMSALPTMAATNTEAARSVKSIDAKKQSAQQSRQSQRARINSEASVERKTVDKQARPQRRAMQQAKRRGVATKVAAEKRTSTVRRDKTPRVVRRVEATRTAARRPDPQMLKTALVSGAASSVVRATDKLQVSAASTASNDDPLALRSGSALVVDEGTDRVLLSKNADTARPIASLTKLMTAAVILDAHQPMDQVIEITDADIDTLKWSSSRLRPGTKLTREELLKLALMSSENRAAHALARNYPGGLAAFIPAMNAKARALGMNSTRYVEPTGLSPENESTAHDLALLVKAAYHYPLIREFSTHPESEVDVGQRTLQFRNTDHLVFNRGWDILLQKTGYINEAGHCLVLQTKFEGRRVIVVLLDAWGKYSHFGDAQRIRNWLEAKGFDGLRDPLASAGVDRGVGHPTLVRTAYIEKVSPARMGE
ncbi:MAG: D-alanyl-D-alanine endopeptidase [Pseudomonadota bacterium]